MVPPLFLSRRRPSDQTKSDSNYYSFYNIKKTKLSARYPFLPKKQIEGKIKHLWERASAEKRATLCLKSSCTTAKSSFKGSILQGLCKKKAPLDQISSYGGHLSDGSPASVAGSCPECTLCSSIKDPRSLTSRKRTLSSAKKHVSTGRATFNLDQSSPPSRPNTRSSIREQQFNEGRVEKTKREKSKLTEDVSQGHMKKRELSLEEKKMYEFEDDGARSHVPSVTKVPVKGGSMTRLRAGVTEHVFDPEQYNLESTVNSGIFIGDNQSPTMTQGHRPQDSTEMRLNGKSPRNLANGKKNCGRRNAKSTKNPIISLGKDQDVKGSCKPNVAARGKKDDVPSTIGVIDDDAREVPWIVSARRDSSSDEVQDNSDDVGNDAFYEYYHKSSSESSAQTLPSLSQESEDISGSQYENKILFSWNGVCFIKQSSGLGTHTPTHSQLSLASMDASEVMSMSSTKASLSPDSPKFDFGFPGKLMTSSTQWFQTPPDIKIESPMSQKRKMRLQDGMTMESSKSSRHHGLDADKPCRVEDVKQALMVIVSPSRKRKMKGEGGEDIVSITTAKKTKKSNNQKLVSPKKAVASQGASLATSSNKRDVLVETNSKPNNPALKTNRTKVEKEDHAATVKARRSGRMKTKESMLNGSLTEEGCAAEGGNNSLGIKYSLKVPQPNREVEDLPHKNRNTKREIKVSSQMMFQSDGILCDLFQPNRSSQKRSFNSPSETEFCQSCTDPVSNHLFLEENFFL